jgi:hypothetical protein
MAVSERTYSFRAPADLAERAQEALRQWAALLEEQPSADDLEFAAQTFAEAWFRRLHELDPQKSQSALFRELVEALVQATERAVEDTRLLPEYRAWAQEDEEGPAWLEAAAKAAAERWRNDE